MTAVAYPLAQRPRAGAAPLLRPVSPRPGPAGASRHVRLRRRRVLTALVATLLGAGVALGGLGEGSLTLPEPASAVGPASAVPVGQASHVVRPGDTLWHIARGLQPEGDVRPLVQRLSAVRGGAPLQVGERVVLPPG